MSRKMRLLAFCAYNALCVGFLIALGPLAEAHGVGPFKEGGLIETIQASLLLLSCAVAAIAARRAPGCRAVLVALAFFAGLGFLRELDSTLDRCVPCIGWEAPAGLVVLGGVVLLRKHWRTLWSEIEAFVPSIPFVTLWFGLILTWGCAQLVGHGQFLRGVMQDYDRHVKRVLEESFETFGMCVILVGVVESVIWARGRRAAVVEEIDAEHPEDRPVA